MAIPLFTLGLLSMLGQVALLRELSVASYGIELIYLLALGFWLFGTGAGSWLSRRIAITSATPVYLLLIIIAVLLPLDMIFIRSMRLAFGGVPGAYLPFPLQLAGIALSLLPVTIPLGILFPWAAGYSIREGKSLASAYAIESAGAVVGGIASTLLLRFGMQNLTIGLLCALVSVLAAVLLVWREEVRSLFRRRWLLYLSLAVSAAIVIALLQSAVLDKLTTSWNHPYLLSSRDTPYGRVSVTKHDGQVSVYENDALIFETEGTSAEEFVHPVMLAHPQPQTVLILGSGLEGTIREVMKHRPQQVDYIEINGMMLSELKQLLPDLGIDTLGALRVQVADPRRALESLGQYDVILDGMPDPMSAQSNRYYTKEFFDLVRSHLREQGVFAFRLRSAENYWTSPLALRNASIVEAAQGIFPNIMVLPGATNIVLAGPSKLTLDPESSRERYVARSLSTRLVTPDYLRYLLTNDRFAEIKERLSKEQAPANTDARPVCFSYGMAVWLSKFAPDLFTMRFGAANTFARHQGIALGLIAFLLAGVAFIVRKKNAIRFGMLAGIAGFCGMLLETILIFNYQIRTGVLYQDIGLLLTLFMFGLMLGASATARIANRLNISPGRRPEYTMRVIGFASITTLVFTTCLIAWLLDGGYQMTLVSTGALLGLAGFFTAMVFVYSAMAVGQQTERSTAQLYAADLVGGGIGSLLGTLVWVPLAGLFASAWLAAIVCAAGMLLL
jgi:spermidine synthase